jgi:hypothetical protein
LLKKGYVLVGACSLGGNAFYVRNDLINERVKCRAIAQAYRSSNCRESRDEFGVLSFLSPQERINLIRGLPVFNMKTGEIELF